MSYIKKFLEQFFKNATKIYLILANVILVVFAIWFSNVGLLPFKNFGDFAFFVILTLVLGIYRPGWTFLFFIGTLVLENINLAPKGLGLSLRPYQFFGFVTILALLVQFASKRIFFSLPKWGWYDALPIVFALAGFLSSLGAADKGASFKQSMIALSFVALYFLVRIYVQSLEDLKRIAPFFLSSGLVVMVYAIWQNIRFLSGANSFEVMPGRPNGTFTEADWLGVFIVFLLVAVFTILYKNGCHSEHSEESREITASNIEFGILRLRYASLRMTVYYLFLTLTFVALILTVSRSAWIGAVIVTVGFLKFVLTDGTFRIREWQWKRFAFQSVFVTVALAVSLGVAMGIPLTRFELFNRVVSTGGLQKITISCPANVDLVVPQNIKNLDEIKPCQHINLEDIAKEKALGNVIMEVNRPDPNVNIRAEIYQKSIAQIKANPVFGLGWNGISAVLGSDERGAGLNASNIFLEIWLGAGLLGFLSFVILLAYILIASVKAFLSNDKNKSGVLIVFVLLGWTAMVIPNLFNSGIFLGFVWAYLGIAVSLVGNRKTGKNI